MTDILNKKLRSLHNHIELILPHLNSKDQLNYIENQISFMESEYKNLVTSTEFHAKLKGHLPSQLERFEKKIYDQAITKFNTSLNKFEFKCKELNKKSITNINYKDASIASIKLIDTLNNIAHDFFIKKIIRPIDFHDQCNEAINQASITLSLHRGWGETLSSLAYIVLSILTLGLAPLAIYAVTGNCSFFNNKSTSSLKYLNELKTDLNAVTCSYPESDELNNIL